MYKNTKTILSYFRKNFVIRKKRGISLYELIIVMSIIAIVTAITIPTINSYLPSLKLSSSARAVSNKLRQAQEEAVTTQLRHGVKFNPVASPPTIAFIKDGTPDTTLETLTLANGITLTVADTIANNLPVEENNSIFFSADGGPDVNGNITVTLLDTSSKIISVSPAGVIKLQ